MNDYPKYYRHRNMAIKRDAEDKAIEVKIPVGTDTYPCSMQDLLFSPGILDLCVKDMEEIDAKTFLSYVGSFTAGARAISEQLNKHQQKLYDNANSKTAVQPDQKKVR
jgi:hypothetical protein